MIKISEEFFSRAEAVQFLRATLKKFKQSVHGTTLSIRRARDYQGWEVSGHRFA